MFSEQANEIFIVGAGNMGAALARGLKGSDLANFSLRVHDINHDRLNVLQQETGADIVLNLKPEPLPEQAVLLCVKPQNLSTVAHTLRPIIRSDTMIISILAGTPLSELEALFDGKGAIVRSMPNVAAAVGASSTALCQNGRLSREQMQLAEKIFNSVGQCWWISEDHLDAVTGLSGSGPAYIYMVIEALTDGGVKMGIPRHLAAAMAAQTVLGSARLVQETGLHPAVLRDKVTTPGGTTITAIHELEERGLRAMLIGAVEAAAQQSARLGAKPVALLAKRRKAG